MLPRTRSVEDKVDPVVASLTPSQKRQIKDVYGSGGSSQFGGKWEPVPHLTPDQIKLVMAEQNSQYTPSGDHRTSQAAMYHHQQPLPTGGYIDASQSRSQYYYEGHSQRYQESPHPPSVFNAPLPEPYHQLAASYPSPSKFLHSETGAYGHHKTATSNLFSLSSTDDWSMDTDNDYSIMVIGVTGSGKSTACNFFLNKKVFNTKGGALAVTIKSDAHSGIVLGKKILFIDTPGFSDAYESEEQRMTDLGRALYFAQAGVHAIVICFNGAARFDTATESVVDAFDQLGTFWPHAFILYSHADDMGSTESEQKQQIFEWIKDPRCPKRLKWLIEKVQYRFMTVESRMRGGDHKYHQYKCNELVGLVEHVYTLNNCQLYTNKLFKWAKQKYDQAKQEKQRQEEELKQCQRNLTEHQELLKSFEEQSIMETRSHQQLVDKLQEEINSLQQQQQQSCFPQEQEELYFKLLQMQASEQEENRKLNSVIQEQREIMEQMRQTLNTHEREQSRLQSLQSQSVVEQYLKSMQEDIRAVKAENKELRDRLMDREKQIQCTHRKADNDSDESDDDLMGIVVKGATTGAKEIVDRGAKYISKKCCIM